MLPQAIVNDVTTHVAVLCELILEYVGDPGRVPPPVRQLLLQELSGVL